MYLVGFTIEIYYDTRPYEGHIRPACYCRNIWNALDVTCN